MEAGAEKNYQHFAWLSRGWVTINNQRWARINFKALNGELDTVNDIYVTAWLGKYVMFNFSSAVMQYESHKAAMEASAKTIALGFVANAPLDGKPVNHPAKRKP